MNTVRDEKTLRVENSERCHAPGSLTSERVMAFGVSIAMGAALLLVAADVSQAEPNRHALRQLTNITVGDVERPKLRSQDADAFAFQATGDLLGIGTSTVNTQIYYWREDTGVITQVTNGIGCDSYDVARPTDGVFSGSRPEVIAFASTCDLDPTRDNSDGNAEIFFWEIFSGTFHQITDTPPGVTNGEPYTSDSGRCLVFSSNGDLDDNDGSDQDHPGPGYSNVDGSQEVFLYSKIDGEVNYPHNAIFTQVSDGPFGTTSKSPVVGGYWFARQCQTTAYQSDHDQLGKGEVGNRIYMYRRPASAVEDMSTADEIAPGPTFPAGEYQNPHISSASPFARGPHIVFESEPDLWNNGSVGNDIFDYRVFHSRMTQFTTSTILDVTKRPNVSDGGGVVVFDSTGEFVSQKREARIGGLPPFNADANAEIYRLKGRKRVFQLTRSEGCENTHVSIKDNGRRILFRSTCDLIPGSNPSGLPQLFLWSLEKSNSPVLASCEEASGCCAWQRKGPASCYEPVFGSKPKPPRPNCLERDRCD